MESGRRAEERRRQERDATKGAKCHAGAGAEGVQKIAAAEATRRLRGAQRGGLTASGALGSVHRRAASRAAPPPLRAPVPSVKLHRIAAHAAVLALAACQRDPGPPGLTREQFIRANVAVRSVSDTMANADSLRARALRASRVTPGQLRAWLAAHQRDPQLLAETWTEIARRADAADSTRRAAGGERPGTPPDVRHPSISFPPSQAAPPSQPPTQAAPFPTPTPGSKPAPPPDHTPARPLERVPEPSLPAARDTLRTDSVKPA